MEYLLVSGAKIGFELEEGFEWFQWDGEADLELPSKGFTIDGHAVATTDDLRNWISKAVMNRQYRGLKGLTFDKPGTVTLVQVDPVQDESTALSINGVRAVTTKSKGEFTLTVNPAFDTKTKRPDVAKHGKWKVLSPGQRAGESD